MSDFSFGRADSRNWWRRVVTTFDDGSSRVSVSLPPPDEIFQPPSLPPPRSPRRLPRPSKAVIKATAIAALLLMGVGLGGRWAFDQIAYWNHNLAGNAAYGRGDWSEAVDQYTQMVQINPRRMDGYSLRGMAYYKMEKYRLSADDDRAAIALTAPDAILWQNLGYADDYAGDHAQAIRDFTEAIRLDPSIPDTPGWTADADDDTGDSHKGRLWAYYHTRQYKLAIEDCDALIARHPYPSSFAVRGKLHREAGDFTAAKADFETAIAHDPHLVNAYGWEEEMLERHGQMSASLALAQKAVRNNPSNIVPLGSLGFTQYTAGQYAQAIATDQQVLAQDASQTWVRFNLGLVYAVQGDWDKAQPVYEEALRQSSGADKAGALGDIRDALAKQSHSAALRQALAMFGTGAQTVAVTHH